MTGTVIIGAGPAGLAAAVCLQRAGLGYRVLERGDAPLTALERVRDDLTLASPTRVSRLPDMREADNAAPYLRFDELRDMLAHYRMRHRIDVDTGVEVARVERAPGGFRIHRSDGQVDACRYVINATGMIGHARMPAEFDAAQCEIPWFHSVDVRPHHVAGARAPLIVGGGMSASEVIEMWLERRDQGTAVLSLRSRLYAMPRAILGVDVHYLSWLPEHLPATFPGAHRLFRRDPVSGYALRRAIRRGLVERVGPVVVYRSREVELAGGRRIAPDLIVFATGFRYAAPHLGDLVDRDDDGGVRVHRCESTRAPGLYVLGVRFGRTLASPYLRGIARDAAYVAARIARARGGR